MYVLCNPRQLTVLPTHISFQASKLSFFTWKFNFYLVPHTNVNPKIQISSTQSWQHWQRTYDLPFRRMLYVIIPSFITWQLKFCIMRWLSENLHESCHFNNLELLATSTKSLSFLFQTVLPVWWLFYFKWWGMAVDDGVLATLVKNYNVFIYTTWRSNIYLCLTIVNYISLSNRVGNTDTAAAQSLSAKMVCICKQGFAK